MGFCDMSTRRIETVTAIIVSNKTTVSQVLKKLIQVFSYSEMEILSKSDQSFSDRVLGQMKISVIYFISRNGSMGMVQNC